MADGVPVPRHDPATVSATDALAWKLVEDLVRIGGLEASESDSLASLMAMRIQLDAERTGTDPDELADAVMRAVHDLVGTRNRPNNLV
ncbi:MAG: hypothetical protein EBU40_10530 [Proteobacteria bacterium]|nr:hypothetical protein [Pseudomonadota bacterium]NBT04423.1 hypothetical protein [Pseudomonadota bacterium]NDF09064.1 hypothetical protein [Pseudomonadota bacterium]NDF38722.1 hypothetical protein [Pseudomonadota bacterium]